MTAFSPIVAHAVDGKAPALQQLSLKGQGLGNARPPAPPPHLRSTDEIVPSLATPRGNYFHRRESISSMALKRIWTEEEDRRLLELRQCGRTSLSVAAKLKRTVKAVNARLSFLRRAEGGHKVLCGGSTEPIQLPAEGGAKGTL